MQFFKLLPLAAGIVLSAGAAQAQTWSTNFDNGQPGGSNGTFSSVTTTGFLSGVVPGADGYLYIGDGLTNGTATFGFTASAATNFFLVTFDATDAPLGDNNLLNVSLSDGTRTQATQFASPATGALIPANPPGTSYSFYFGTDGTPWNAGNYTLTFNNGSPLATFALDNVNVSAVPEPETYAMVLAGLGVLGFVARRRKAG